MSRASSWPCAGAYQAVCKDVPAPSHVIFPSPCPSPVLAQNAERLDSEIVYDRDFDYDYFGFKVRLGRVARRCVCFSDSASCQTLPFGCWSTGFRRMLTPC